MSLPLDILFCSYGGGHVTALVPVAKEMLRRGYNAHYFALTTAQSIVDAAEVPWFGYRHLEEATDPQIQTWGRELVDRGTSAANIPYAESVAYHGLNYRDLVIEHGEAGAKEQYKQWGRQCFDPKITMRNVLRNVRPRLLVSTISPRSERAMFQAARDIGVSSICVADLFARQQVQWLKQPRYATKFCVLNKDVADFFIRNGCQADAVYVTGNPAFDNINSVGTIEAARVWRRSLPAKYKTTILWASQVEPERHPFTGALGNTSLPQAVENSLRKLVASRDDILMVERYHPSENRAFQPAKNVRFSPREEPLHPILHAVDYVVTMTSTVAIEAHIAGKPVLSVQGSVFSDDAPFEEFGIASPVSGPGALPGELMERIAGKSGIQCGLASRDNQSATQKIADHIEELLTD